MSTPGRKTIAIMGAGGMGTALSVLLSGNGHNVRLWSPFPEEADMINRLRENTVKLPGVSIPEEVFCSPDAGTVLDGAELLVMAVPSQKMRESAVKASRYIGNGMIVTSCSKGLEEGTCLTMSGILCQELPGADIVALSGPCHAEELARGIPTAVVAASDNEKAAKHVQDVFMNPMLRVYTHDDMTGVELGGALKNIIALCAGISDGLGFGDNTKAALMTRGIAEIARLGSAMGASPRTFSGLAGIGDLIVTCTSMHSRNRRAGILIGQGKKVDEALAEINMTVEGVAAAKPAYLLANKMNVSMPIITEAHSMIFCGKDPGQAVIDLMMRGRRNETD